MDNPVHFHLPMIYALLLFLNHLKSTFSNKMLVFFFKCIRKASLKTIPLKDC